MYDYIKGKLTYTESDHVVVEAGGIGYRIFCTNPMSVRMNEDKETILYLHHHVREDAQLLYGFSSREERRMFRLLLEVSGIGPKGAIGALSSATPQQIALAIAQEDVKGLTRLPGIGVKTAKRLILDLKDKLKAESPHLQLSDVLPVNPEIAVEESNAQGFTEALEALLVLGFHEDEVLPVLKDLLKENETLTADQMVRQALKALNRF